MTPPLDIEDPRSLIDYLRRTARIGAAEEVRMTVLRGGVSNRTVLIERDQGEAWVAKQALEKLRVRDDWFSSPGRILVEAAGMRALERLAPAGSITKLLHLDTENFVLLMEAVPRPHENWKTMLLAGRVEHDHFEQFAQLLASIHRGGATPEFAREFADRSIFESLRLEPYYETTAARVPEAAGFLSALLAETRARRVTLVHGDFSPKNILVHAGRLVLLDHEVMHFGDPAFDVGFALAHLLSKAHHVTGRRGCFAAEAESWWQTYREAGGLAEEGPSARHTLGCLLARVWGRSPLEYLSDTERVTQSAAVLQLMASPPLSVPRLVRQFTNLLS